MRRAGIVPKHKFEDLSPAGQQLLEDFETNRLAKRRNTIIVQKPPPFRSHVSCTGAAAEHAAASSSTSVKVKEKRKNTKSDLQQWQRSGLAMRHCCRACHDRLQKLPYLPEPV